MSNPQSVFLVIISLFCLSVTLTMVKELLEASPSNLFLVLQVHFLLCEENIFLVILFVFRQPFVCSLSE